MIDLKQMLLPEDKTLPKPEQIYTVLKRSILNGSIPAGTHLTETDICSDMDLSRTPVHQAVVRLEAEHLIRTLPKKGLVVLEINPQDIINLYEVSEALESKAASLAANSCPAFHLMKLDKLSKEADTGKQRDDAAPRDLNYIFHLAVAEASGNELLYEMIRTTRDRLSLLRFSTQIKQASHEISVSDASQRINHASIVDAIRRHDPEEASRVMQEHIRMTKNRIIDNIIY